MEQLPVPDVEGLLRDLQSTSYPTRREAVLQPGRVSTSDARTVSFEFRNRAYAELFARANGARMREVVDSPKAG